MKPKWTPEFKAKVVAAYLSRPQTTTGAQVARDFDLTDKSLPEKWAYRARKLAKAPPLTEKRRRTGVSNRSQYSDELRAKVAQAYRDRAPGTTSEQIAKFYNIDNPALIRRWAMESEESAPAVDPGPAPAGGKRGAKKIEFFRLYSTRPEGESRAAFVARMRKEGRFGNSTMYEWLQEPGATERPKEGKSKMQTATREATRTPGGRLYTREFKLKAMEAYRNRGDRTWEEVSAELGIPNRGVVIYQWLKNPELGAPGAGKAKPQQREQQVFDVPGILAQYDDRPPLAEKQMHLVDKLRATIKRNEEDLNILRDMVRLAIKRGFLDLLKLEQGGL
jgi:transposase-like protein